MRKRLKFLKCIVDEPIETMVCNFFKEQRKETRKGDFVNCISEDLKKLELKTEYKDFEGFTKSAWNKKISDINENLAF